MKETDSGMHERSYDGDAAEWFGFFTELTYAKLGPRDWFSQLPHYELEKPSQKSKGIPRGETSLFVPGPGKAAITKLGRL
jgi:hypothetical protein